MENHKRSKKHKRSKTLENLLSELNNSLSPIEKDALINAPEIFEHPLILVLGAPRSGTTLLMQYLASQQGIAYPTNFLSRFYKAPYVGIRMQQIFSEYDHLNEFPEFSKPLTFDSELGKTNGTMAPNEFWYFWRRFLSIEQSALPERKELDKFDFDGLQEELSLMIHTFNKPLAMKGMIVNFLSKILYQKFNKVIFIHVERELKYNMNSLLKARLNYFNSLEEWYSFPPGPNFKKFPHSTVFEEVAAQISDINYSITQDLSKLPNLNSITIKYSEFCKSPDNFALELQEKLQVLGVEANFKSSNKFNEQKSIESEWQEQIEAVSKSFQKISLG